MKTTEQCIDLLQQNITELAEQAYYNTYECQSDEECFTNFMDNFTQQLEHIACEFWLAEVFKYPPCAFEGLTGQTYFYDVQNIIDKEGSKK